MDADFWHERWSNEQIGFHQADINAWLLQHWPLLAVPKGATYRPLSVKFIWWEQVRVIPSC